MNTMHTISRRPEARFASRMPFALFGSPAQQRQAAHDAERQVDDGLQKETFVAAAATQSVACGTNMSFSAWHSDGKSVRSNSTQPISTKNAV